MSECSRSIERALEKGAGGVILCARLVGLVDEPKLSICWCLRHKYNANPDMPDADYALEQLINIMEQ